MTKKFSKLMNNGASTINVRIKDGSIWMQLNDDDGDLEALQSFSKESATMLATHLLMAASGITD